MTVQMLASSFRDSAGRVIRQDDKILRLVYTSYQTEYEHLMGSGLYEELINEGLLIEHEEVATSVEFVAESEIYKVLQPREIPFISYPYEWSFSALKEAALLTLRIQNIALRHGMILRDANAFNVQFLGACPIFIDTLSFGMYREGDSWSAYRQFCQHFLNPLALMSRCDVRLGQMSRIFIDGIPADLAVSILPWKERMCFSLLTHVYMQSWFQSKYQRKEKSQSRKEYLSLTSLKALLKGLEGAVHGLEWAPNGTEWVNYYHQTNYSDQAMTQKIEIVQDWLGRVKPSIVWDYGANTGRFSRLAANAGAQVVAFDIDPGAVEWHFRTLHGERNLQIVPLLQDFTNPSSGLGWAGEERDSLMQRGPAGMILALALLHHLVIGNNVPMHNVAEFFARCCRWLIIEFVPKEDSQVQRMLERRQDIWPDYNDQGFIESFEKFFVIRDSTHIEGSKRVIYLMEQVKNV